MKITTPNNPRMKFKNKHVLKTVIVKEIKIKPVKGQNVPLISITYNEKNTNLESTWELNQFLNNWQGDAYNLISTIFSSYYPVSNLETDKAKDGEFLTLKLSNKFKNIFSGEERLAKRIHKSNNATLGFIVEFKDGTKVNGSDFINKWFMNKKRNN